MNRQRCPVELVTMATSTAKQSGTNGTLPPGAGAATVMHANQPSPSQERTRQLEAIAEAVTGLIARQRMAAEQQDRREALRNPFIHPVVIVTGAEPPHRALTR